MTRKITLLNSSILTDYGTYQYRPLTLDEARAIVADARAAGDEIESAIGHQSTAELLSALLGVAVETNRIEYRQRKGDVALVFKLSKRPPEGVVLTRDELEKLGYEFGLLTRLD